MSQAEAAMPVDESTMSPAALRSARIAIRQEGRNKANRATLWAKWAKRFRTDFKRPPFISAPLYHTEIHVLLAQHVWRIERTVKRYRELEKVLTTPLVVLRAAVNEVWDALDLLIKYFIEPGYRWRRHGEALPPRGLVQLGYISPLILATDVLPENPLLPEDVDDFTLM
ncbi:hypothetical protein BJ508DRAFT_171347 [Ascobolus immersus RN42]|uniref:Uncharacterized protein n=1 Tax=Ascobolus immersus RN42 TaxID=1160509 RepID=A0A3N4HUQ4_ASCIM|nr:hypothetical protein BJ508DRAFT_171347 [Ascobolus immersus RN42]